jgi:hypothetical protein
MWGAYAQEQKRYGVESRTVRCRDSQIDGVAAGGSVRTR